MDDLTFFIDTFIDKARRERWHELREKGCARFFKNIGQLERHLNQHCVLFELNAWEEVLRYAHKHKLGHVTYYDYATEGSKLSLADASFHDDSLLINKEKRCAFFCHHDGWVWICSAKG